jgi:hypothetical protein
MAYPTKLAAFVVPPQGSAVMRVELGGWKIFSAGVIEHVFAFLQCLRRSLHYDISTWMPCTWYEVTYTFLKLVLSLIYNCWNY